MPHKIIKGKNMITTNDRIRALKRKIEDPDIPLEDKHDILDFFMEYNNILNNNRDMGSFFNELIELTDK